MSKRVNDIVIDDKEDRRIKKAAYRDDYKNNFICIILISIVILLIIPTCFFTKYYIENYTNDISKIVLKEGELIIVNGHGIDEVINNDSFDNSFDDLKFESKSYIEYVGSSHDMVNYNVRYIINDNDFEAYNSKDGTIYVKFYYSYDNINWTEISNVIRIDNSTITPTNTNFYNLSDRRGILKISSNSKIKSGQKIYWKSVTVIKNNQGLINDKKIKTSLRIEY